MKIFFKHLTFILFSSTAFVNQINAQDNLEGFSCLEDTYSFNQCNFEVPKLNNGETTVISSETGLF